MALVMVNVGSNLGKRKEWIETALEMISERFGICCRSSYIETAPWGFKSGNRFLNLGVSFNSEEDPEDILRALQEIEGSISKVSHRDFQGHYKDREVDIDIMAIGGIRYESPRLKIPHPHLLEREFFIKPLKELSPDWEYPQLS